MTTNAPMSRNLLGGFSPQVATPKIPDSIDLLIQALEQSALNAKTDIDRRQIAGSIERLRTFQNKKS